MYTYVHIYGHEINHVIIKYIQQPRDYIAFEQYRVQNESQPSVHITCHVTTVSNPVLSLLLPLNRISGEENSGIQLRFYYGCCL